MIDTAWTEIGGQVVGEDERERFLAVAERTRWVEPTGRHPLMQAAALNALVKQFDITNAEKIGYSEGWRARGVEEGGYYGIVGIRTKRQRLYFVDRGSDILPTLIVTDKEGGPA